MTDSAPVAPAASESTEPPPPAPAKRQGRWARRGGLSFTLAAAVATAGIVGALLVSPVDRAVADEGPVDESLFPVPTVVGPVASSVGDPEIGHTFMSSSLVKNRGYVEEEFFYSGEANRYTATVAGGIGSRPIPSSTADIVSTDHAYTTRMVVRRPDNPANFNGTVIVEWQNATSGYDVEAMWYRTHEQMMRDGYAWVGITAQSVPITNPTLGLKQFDPQRYGGLDLTAGGQFTSGDPLSYDAYGQGIQAVRHAGVLGDLEDSLETVVAAGVSQSAGRLSVFTNAIQTRGEPVADAILLFIGGEKMRSDLTVPVFKVYSESESAAAVFNTLQPDTAMMRTWHVTGTTHSDWQSMIVRYPELTRDQPTAALADTCAQGPTRSRIPERYTWAAATEHLVTWVRDGVQPPTADPLFTADGTIERDAFGNAFGGLRLAPVQVPIARAAAGCGLNGIYEPFDTETLRSLYPDRDSYLLPFGSAVEENVADGYVLADDADEMRRDAQSSIVGLGLVCEEHCANVSQFPAFPSTQTLRDIVASFYLPGGAALVASLDRATLAVATGQTTTDQRGIRYADAISQLTSFRSMVEDLRVDGGMTADQARVLAEFSDVLITRLSFTDVDVSVVTRCLGSNAYVSVTVENAGSVTGGIRIDTDFGVKASLPTTVGTTRASAFNSRTGDLAAGVVSATITATVDGQPATVTRSAEYAARTCG